MITQFLEELEKLNFPRDKFAIFGSGPLGIRNLRESHDLDIIVKNDLWQEIVGKYPSKDGRNDAMRIGNVDIFKDWKPWFSDVNELIDSADVISGFRLVKLEYVLRWKKFMGREKDKRDIELITEYLQRNT